MRYQIAALLICLLQALPAGEAVPVVYRHSADEVVSYLIIDGTRVVTMSAAGELFSASRLIDVDGRTQGYAHGKVNLAVFERTPASVRVGGEGFPAAVFTRCADAPEAVGLQPYSLPPATTDTAKRSEIASEIRRRFELEQRLRGVWIGLAKGRMDREAMQRDDVRKALEAVNAADEDNRAWLEKTLRTDGWIGRATHGDQAHEALVLIALHNIAHVRLTATILEQLRAEWKRGEIGEMAVANLADRQALMLGDPLSYGIQATGDAAGRTIIPVIADGATLDANRQRIGQPPMAQAAAQMRATVLRIGEDGRLVGQGAIGAKPLDLIDSERAQREPRWALEEAGRVDAALGTALAAAAAGNSAPLTAWATKAEPGHRQLITRMVMALGSQPDTDQEAAVVAVRPLFDGVIDATPAGDDLRVMVANVLAYSLVARSAAPTAGELARAVELNEMLVAALKRSEVSSSPLGHALTDTVACVRFRQGDRVAAATAWKQAIALSGADVPELYRRRLAAAESAESMPLLPR